MLEGDGYRVLAAKDGAEALEMFEEHMDEIGLVLCDLACRSSAAARFSCA